MTPSPPAGLGRGFPFTGRPLPWVNGVFGVVLAVELAGSVAVGANPDAVNGRAETLIPTLLIERLPAGQAMLHLDTITQESACVNDVIRP